MLVAVPVDQVSNNTPKVATTTASPTGKAKEESAPPCCGGCKLLHLLRHKQQQQTKKINIVATEIHYYFGSLTYNMMRGRCSYHCLTL